MTACPTLTRRSLRGLVVALCGLLALTVSAAVTDPGFTDSLSSTEQMAMGLAKLSAVQRTTLNTEVQHDVILARQGDVTGFASTFTQRHTATERTAAGLDLLGNDERRQLDAFVARAIAQPPTTALMHLSKHGDEIEVTTYRPEIHGEVTVVAGASSHGGSFYGGAFTGIYDDPGHNFSLAVTYAEIHSKGMCADPLLLTPDTTSCGPGLTPETSTSAQMRFGPFR